MFPLQSKMSPKLSKKYGKVNEEKHFEQRNANSAGNQSWISLKQKGKKIEEKSTMILSIFKLVLAQRQHSKREGSYDFIKYGFSLEIYKESINSFEIFQVLKVGRKSTHNFDHILLSICRSNHLLIGLSSQKLFPYVVASACRLLVTRLTQKVSLFLWKTACTEVDCPNIQQGLIILDGVTSVFYISVLIEENHQENEDATDCTE